MIESPTSDCSSTLDGKIQNFNLVNDYIIIDFKDDTELCIGQYMNYSDKNSREWENVNDLLYTLTPNEAKESEFIQNIILKYT